MSVALLCFTSLDFTYSKGFHFDNGVPFRLTNINGEIFSIRSLHLSGHMMIFIKLNPRSHSALLTGIRLRMFERGDKSSGITLESSL